MSTRGPVDVRWVYPRGLGLPFHGFLCSIISTCDRPRDFT